MASVEVSAGAPISSGRVAGAGSASKLPEVVGRIWFLVMMEFRAELKMQNSNLEVPISEKELPPSGWAHGAERLGLLF